MINEIKEGMEAMALDSLQIFASPESMDVIGELEATEICEVAGRIVQVGDRHMLPIKPRGVVNVNGVEILGCEMKLEPVLPPQTVVGDATLPGDFDVALPAASGSESKVEILVGDTTPRGAPDGTAAVAVEVLELASPPQTAVGDAALSAKCNVALPAGALLAESGASLCCPLLSRSELESAVRDEATRLQARTRVANSLKRHGRPEAELRRCERNRDQLADNLTRLETAVAKDDAYRNALVQTMYGTRTRRENDRGLREWAEEQMTEFKALVSGGPPEHVDDARLWQRAVGLSRDRLRNKRVELILADVTARDDHSKALENDLKNVREALCVAESAVANLQADAGGCPDMTLANDLVEESRAMLDMLRQALACRPLPLAIEERIATNKARALELRAAKRARMGCP